MLRQVCTESDRRHRESAAADAEHSRQEPGDAPHGEHLQKPLQIEGALVIAKVVYCPVSHQRGLLRGLVGGLRGLLVSSIMPRLVDVRLERNQRRDGHLQRSHVELEARRVRARHELGPSAGKDHASQSNGQRHFVVDLPMLHVPERPRSPRHQHDRQARSRGQMLTDAHPTGHHGHRDEATAQAHQRPQAAGRNAGGRRSTSSRGQTLRAAAELAFQRKPSAP
mmetsp:Transcript_10678/g.40169  ORF Transcript_10678/g.40169 Transcript_10678/m.40169 type:complete len:224 (+) Transcript_10678:381-1052(+)